METSEEIRLEKNKNYWGEKAKVDEVVFKVVPEDATRIERSKLVKLTLQRIYL